MSEISAALTDVLGETRHLGAQLYVSLDGTTVCDLAVGERDDGEPLGLDDRLVWFSAGKPFLAAAICVLWQAGKLDLDTPVATYIEGYEADGKQDITCRHLLTHSAGRMIVDDPGQVTAAFSVDYEPAVAVACAARLHPDDVPGKQSSYSSSTVSWLVLSEVVRRVDGRRFDDFVTEEICTPLGIRAQYGFSTEQLQEAGATVTTYQRPRQARYLSKADASEGAAIQGVMRSRTFHRSVDPAAGLWASARAVGRFYEFLCDRATAHGGPVDDPSAAASSMLGSGVVAEMIGRQRPSFFEETPLIDFGLGLTLETRCHGAQYAYFGSHCGLRTFGHQGHGSPMAYVDPDHRLVVAFNGNGLPGRVVGKMIWRQVSDAVYRELGLAEENGPPAGQFSRPRRERVIDLRPSGARD